MKLTSAMLRKIIMEEAAKFGKERSVKDAAKDTEEVDADGFADTLEKKIDFEKALKLEETRLLKRVKRIREARRRVRRDIVKGL